METRRKQSPEEIAYLAGLIDSDGYIGIVKGAVNKAAGCKNPAYTVTVNFTSTSLEIMEWLVEHFGSKYYSRTMPKKENWKQCYNWINTNQKGRMILELIKDHLVVKREQAYKCLDLMDNWIVNKHGTPKEELARRERIYREVRELNTTGLVQRERLNSEAPSLEG